MEKHHLIGLYLKGEASKTQRKELESWIAESETNRQEFEALRSVWERTEGLRKDREVATDEAWARFQQTRPDTQSGSGKVLALRSWALRIAALLVLGLGIGYLLLKPTPATTTILVQTGAGEEREVELPDGTVGHVKSKQSLDLPRTI